MTRHGHARLATDPSRTVRTQYLVIGAVLGGLWWWGAGEPAWVHAVRTALFVVVLFPAGYYGAQALRARRGKAPLPTISVARVVGAKLALLVVALIVDALIAGVTTDADSIIAVGLFLAVALAGPPCHHLVVAPARDDVTDVVVAQ